MSITARPEPTKRFTFVAEKFSRVSADSLSELLTLADNSFENLFACDDNGPWWLDCCNLTEPELNALFLAFDIHQLTREDISVREDREKFQRFPNYYLLNFHTIAKMELAHCSMILMPKGVITFTFQNLEHGNTVRNLLRSRDSRGRVIENSSFSSSQIVFLYMSDIVESLYEQAELSSQETSKVDSGAYSGELTTTLAETLMNVSQARKNATSLLRLVEYKDAVIRSVYKRVISEMSDPTSLGAATFSHMDNQELIIRLEDLERSVVAIKDSLAMNEKMLSRAHGNYLSSMQVRLAKSSNFLTAILGKATLIAAVLIPMNFLTGLWGMNVKIPGMHSDNLGWFFGVTAFIVIVSVVAVFVSHAYIRTMDGHNVFSEDSSDTFMDDQGRRKLNIWGTVKDIFTLRY